MHGARNIRATLKYATQQGNTTIKLNKSKSMCRGVEETSSKRQIRTEWGLYVDVYATVDTGSVGGVSVWVWVWACEIQMAVYYSDKSI